MKLFQIDEAIEALLGDPAVMDPETGELLDEGPLKELEGEKERIVLYLARYALGELTEADAVQAHVDRLSKRATGHRNRAKSLKHYIAQWCVKGEKFKDDTVKVRIGEVVSVDVFDEAEVPEEYKVQPPLPDLRVDKKAIKSYLDDGGRVEGAQLSRRRNTVIS